MEKQTMFTEEQIEKGTKATKVVLMQMAEFNKLTKGDASPEVYANNLTKVKEISASLLMLESISPKPQETAAKREAIRKEVFAEDGNTVKENLMCVMMAMAVAGLAADSMGQQMIATVVYWPVIAELAEMYSNELATKK